VRGDFHRGALLEQKNLKFLSCVSRGDTERL
jgi:hypothetical protein